MDYNLVIIGATHAGLVTAKKAIAQNLRVALVQQTDQPLQDLQERALQKVLFYAVQSQSENIEALIAAAIAPLDVYEILAKLTESGVDLIQEKGHFQWLPEISFATKTRQLKAHNFVIATGTVQDDLLSQNSFSLVDLVANQAWHKLAENIVITGQEPQSLSLAYSLAKLGKNIQLVLNNRLFSAETPDCTHRIQTFLEVAGVEIYRNLSTVEQQEVLAQENVTVIGRSRRAATTQLNLPQDFCRPQNMWLKVNPYLQTSRSNIFGCGSVLGGYNLPELAIAEAETIISNITQKKKQICPYATTPYRLFEPFPFDHVGYQSNKPEPEIIVKQQNFVMDRLDQLEFPLDLTVKLWLDSQQKLLGATVLGDSSGKLIYYCRDLIQNRHTFTTWDNLLEQSGLFVESW
ncbi:MAG: FAD-dependent oxidoreductase [Limnothrix sp.]